MEQANRDKIAKRLQRLRRENRYLRAERNRKKQHFDDAFRLLWAVVSSQPGKSVKVDPIEIDFYTPGNTIRRIDSLSGRTITLSTAREST